MMTFLFSCHLSVQWQKVCLIDNLQVARMPGYSTKHRAQRKIAVELSLSIQRNQWTCYRRTCREAANCRYKIYSQAKNQHFRPTGTTSCTEWSVIWHGQGHVHPLGGVKFHAHRCTEVGTRPTKFENFHFLVKSCPSGVNPLINLYNC